MKQISWYRSIRFRIPAVIALVLLVPIVVFWHYSMELTRKNMLSQTSNLIYTNLYGASLLMDDVISTGGSLHAMEALVEMAGGTVTGRVAVLAEGGAADRTDIRFLEKLPVFNADGTVKE